MGVYAFTNGGNTRSILNGSFEKSKKLGLVPNTTVIL